MLPALHIVLPHFNLYCSTPSMFLLYPEGWYFPSCPKEILFSVDVIWQHVYKTCPKFFYLKFLFQDAASKNYAKSTNNLKRERERVWERKKVRKEKKFQLSVVKRLLWIGWKGWEEGKQFSKFHFMIFEEKKFSNKKSFSI